MPANFIPKISPILNTKNIQDINIRKNFELMNDYFRNQNQLLNFKFFEVYFDSAESNRIINHGLTFTPRDILRLELVGSAVITFHRTSFSNTKISISSTGEARVRFFLGTYFGAEPTDTKLLTEDEVWRPDAAATSTTETIVTSTDTDTGTDTTTDSSDTTQVPIGGVLIWPSATIPDNYLLCDGSAISRADYADLFAVIGITHGSGDTFNTFNIPNYEGYFLRGTDNGAGVDPNAGTRTAMATGGNTGDNVGSIQTDAFQAHGHENRVLAGTTAGTSDRLLRGGAGSTANVSGMTLDATTNGGGTPRTSTESRPKNAYVNFIIRYA